MARWEGFSQCPGCAYDFAELLPLDDERRAENEVWLAFTARALIDPQLRVRHAEMDDALRAACRERPP